MLKKLDPWNQMGYRDSVIKSFFKRINYPGNDEECWIWISTLDKDGYGCTVFRKKFIRIHRFIYECYFGAIPNGMLVCHHCDNPACCNPNHLFIGTITDNNRDKEAKGRGNHKVGEDCVFHQTDLTKTKVEELLSDIYYRQVSTVNDIMKKYNLSRQGVFDILNGKIWKHVTSKISKDELKRMKDSVTFQKSIDEFTAIQIKQLIKQGIKAYTISKMLNLPMVSVYKIQQGKTWTNIVI